MNKFIKLFKKDKDEFGYLTDEPFDIRKIIPVAALLAAVIFAVCAFVLNVFVIVWFAKFNWFAVQCA